jgi:hypothetical protein
MVCVAEVSFIRISNRGVRFEREDIEQWVVEKNAARDQDRMPYRSQAQRGKKPKVEAA